MTKRKSIFLIFIATLLIICISLGVSYSYFKKTNKQSLINTAATKCLELSLTGKNEIDLQRTIPISDEEGMGLEPYIFTVTNTCSSSIEYDVILESLVDTSFQNTSIQVALNNDYNLYSEYNDATKTFTDSISAKRLKRDVLDSENNSKTYELRLWIDKDAPLTEQNKTFLAKIIIYGAAVKLDSEGNIVQGGLSGGGSGNIDEPTPPVCNKPEIDHNLLCHRATTLHTEICNQSSTSHYCSASGSIGKGNTITYGNTTITSGEYHTGDAFTCDVNSDGIYDEEKERFYYVSDYFNPNTQEFDPQTATLIYYSNTMNDTPSLNTISYYGSNNYQGPISAATYLPKVSQWKNTRLIQAARQILAVPTTDNPLLSYKYTMNNGTKNDLVVFDYSLYAARLLTAQEIIKGCGIMVGKEGEEMNGQLENQTPSCRFLLENTKYASNSSANGYWLENPRYAYDFSIYYVNGVERLGYDRNIISHWASNNSLGVRPAIDVAKSELSC
ncbi:MAG: hypothetical protein ACI31M_00845 [Bacilli bacterium]